MSLSAGRVGVRADQVDSYGRVISPSFLNEIMEDLPEWTDLPVRVNGTEELIPSNPSVPVTSPILADIDYPDVRRNNQYFTYRETPTPVDGLAKIKSIKGNTLVWNQLVQASNVVATKTVNGVTFTNNANGTVTMSGTASQLIVTPIATGVTIEQNHVYYLGKGSTWSFMNGYGADGYGLIKHNRANATIIYVYIQKGDSVNETVYVQCIDFTKLFGESKANEIFAMGADNGIAYFKSLFPLNYYSYDSGSLLSFNGTGLKTTGFNQWDEQWENTTNLPIQTYFPTGMKSAYNNNVGTVYDELTPTKAITRIGSVDVETLGFQASTTFFYTSNTQSLNIVKGRFSAIKSADDNIINAFCYESGQLRIYVKDISKALSGVLYYELATSVELPTLDFGE